MCVFEIPSSCRPNLSFHCLFAICLTASYTSKQLGWLLWRCWCYTPKDHLVTVFVLLFKCNKLYRFIIRYKRSEVFRHTAFNIGFCIQTVCVCALIIPKNSVNALRIVQSTEPQQIDKNTNGITKMHYYYWVEKYLLLCILLIVHSRWRPKTTADAKAHTHTRTLSIQFCTLDISQ